MQGKVARSNGRTVNIRRFENMRHLRRRLRAFYKHQPRFKNKFTRLDHLKWHQIEGGNYPRLQAKAAQTRHLVPLLVQLCAENPTIFKDDERFLSSASQALHAFHKCVDSSPRVPNASQQARMEAAAIRFLWSWKEYGGHIIGLLRHL